MSNLSKEFNERGIFLLRNPRKKLRPGLVYQTEEDDIHAHRFIMLENILEHKDKDNPVDYKLPKPETDEPRYTLEGVIQNKTSLSVALDFTENLFNKIKTGLGSKILAMFSNDKIVKGIFQISSITTEEILVGDLEGSLKNYIVKI